MGRVSEAHHARWEGRARTLIGAGTRGTGRGGEEPRVRRAGSDEPMPGERFAGWTPREVAHASRARAEEEARAALLFARERANGEPRQFSAKRGGGARTLIAAVARLPVPIE